MSSVPSGGAVQTSLLCRELAQPSLFDAARLLWVALRIVSKASGTFLVSVLLISHLSVSVRSCEERMYV